jgi:hypothetical protein
MTQFRSPQAQYVPLVWSGKYVLTRDAAIVCALCAYYGLWTLFLHCCSLCTVCLQEVSMEENCMFFEGNFDIAIKWVGS